MKTLGIFIGFLVLLLNYGSISQEGTEQIKYPSEPKPFVKTEELGRIPKVVVSGLTWPTDEEIRNKRVSINSEIQNQINKTITKCLSISFYDPNNSPSIISLRNWPEGPDPNLLTNISQYAKKDYLINIHDKKGSIFIGIKRLDNKTIWNMDQEPSRFLPWAIKEFFVSQNVSPQPDKEVHYVPDKDGIRGFYYAYLPVNKKSFWAAYLWTDGNNIVLHMDKLFDENKAKKGIPAPK